MASNLSLNQFAPNTPLDGMYVYMANEGQLHNVIVGEDTTLKAGDLVMLDGTSTNTNAPVVVAFDSTSDTSTPIPFGVVSYNPIKSSYTTGERVGLARDFDVIWKTANGAIPVGTPIMFDVNNKVGVLSGSSHVVEGIALTPASADGDLIQVELRIMTAG